MKIEWVNKGENFNLPKINADMDIEILTYMETLDKELSPTLKNIYEFRETVFKVLNSIDKNITKELVTKNLTVNELGTLYIVMRQHGKTKYKCPHCKKSFVYEDMPVEGDIPLPEKKKSDATVTKKEI
jgi:hypothetical protein